MDFSIAPFHRKNFGSLGQEIHIVPHLIKAIEEKSNPDNYSECEKEVKKKESREGKMILA